MLLKINKLKKFGVYQNFAWGSLDDFKHKNLIYGWNYSGKTTLSKLFQILEFKDKNRCFSGAEFEIIEGGEGLPTKTFTQDTISAFPFTVKVFNSEYIKRVFTWDEPTTGFKPISFYLGDVAGDLKKKIEKLKIVNKRFETLRDEKYKIIIDEFENYNKQSGHFTRKAKDLRDNYLPGLYHSTTFDKGHFKNIVDVVKSDSHSFILENDVRNFTKQEALAEKKFESINEKFTIQEKLELLSKKVKIILEDTAPKAVSFPEIEADPVLFSWIQQGVILHTDATECKFCTNPLLQDRITDLNSFYSKKLNEIQNNIKESFDLIQEEKQVIEIKFPDKRDIAEQFQSEFAEAVTAYESQQKIYKQKLVILENDLESKGSNIFNTMNATEIELVTLKEKIEKIEEVLVKHNEWLEKFEERKKTAIDKILNHYVAEYLINENYLKKEEDKISAVLTIAKIEKRIIDNNTLLKKFNEELSSTSKGQGEINEILQILLHRNDIKVEIKDSKFILERLSFPAENLSEGEKSAIAFAYFLTELKSLRGDELSKLKETIIFIDDPISSLDSNHIFQVRSLLSHFLNENDFIQLFISTHNFEFFSVMLDSDLFKNIARSTTKENKRTLYFIKRNDKGCSTIEKIPKSFSEHKSEYISIFHILKNYNDLEDKSTFEYSLLLPNALRRFLELYTAIKYPTSKTVDDRIKEVFTSTSGTFHNVKLLHWFSHQNQYEKVQQHDDKLLQIDDAISDLLDFIKQEDELHWKGLIEIQ